MSDPDVIGAAPVPSSGPADGGGRGRRPGLPDLPLRALATDLVQQSFGACEPRGQEKDRRGGHPLPRCLPRLQRSVTGFALHHITPLHGRKRGRWRAGSAIHGRRFSKVRVCLLSTSLASPTYWGRSRSGLVRLKCKTSKKRTRGALVSINQGLPQEWNAPSTP